MCTAISLHGARHLFGRTLDLERSYRESVVIIPRKFEHRFLYEVCGGESLAIMGVAHVADGVPLLYDAVNECGLYAAGLNFPHEAVYTGYRQGVKNLASFEVIPYILSRCKSLDEAVAVLESANIVGDSYSSELPATPLHWFIGDARGAVTAEPTSAGLKVYENPFGVMTNSPDFKSQVRNLANYMKCTSLPPKNSICPGVTLTVHSRGVGGVGLPGDFSSESRFVRAVFAKNHTVCQNSSEISSFFHIMDSVCVPRGCIMTDENLPVSTVYTSACNICEGEYFFTTYSNRRIRAVRFKSENLDSASLISYPMESEEDIDYMNSNTN